MPGRARAAILRVPFRCAADHPLKPSQVEGGYHGHSFYDEQHEWKFCTFPLATEGTWLPGDKPCHYCPDMPGITRDHVVPRAKRGLDREWNVVPACVSCNGCKRDKMPTCRCEVCVHALAQWMEMMELDPADFAVYVAVDTKISDTLVDDCHSEAVSSE